MKIIQEIKFTLIFYGSGLFLNSLLYLFHAVTFREYELLILGQLIGLSGIIYYLLYTNGEIFISFKKQSSLLGIKNE